MIDEAAGAFVLRKANPRDWRSIARMFRRWLPWVPEGEAAYVVRNRPDSVHVAEWDGEIVGCLVYESHRTPGTAFIDYLIVDRPGIGLGTRIIEAAVEKAASSGCNAVGLSVQLFNAPAIAFYRKRGFVETNRADQEIGMTRQVHGEASAAATNPAKKGEPPTWRRAMHRLLWFALVDLPRFARPDAEGSEPVNQLHLPAE